MGEIADAMINGELCEGCGVYLEPNKAVYNAQGSKFHMPSNGEPFGTPVMCESCND